MKNYQLSLPGPSEVDPEVLQAMARPNLPHYGNLWMEIYQRIINNLRTVYRTKGRVFVLPCSGSGAIDSVFCSIGARRGIVLSNGNFGMRVAEIAGHHLDAMKVIENNVGQEFRIEQVERELESCDYDLLAVVQGETSTGMLNHLAGLAKLCQRRGLLFFVDAVSTLGGVPLEFDQWGIDFCVSASQKALGALPGLSTIAISEKGWSSLAREQDIKGWYLNIRTWDRFATEWSDWHPYPVTLPVHLLFAFSRALELVVSEGLEGRWARHDEVSRALHEGLRSIGIPLLIEEESNRLATTTAATLPEGLTSEGLQEHLKERFGILVAGGVGPLRKRVFRVGHMGYSAQHWVVNRVMAAIRDYLEVSLTGEKGQL
jgi:alanine-glyoxylate transaminase / serine-glyoxylate transaminase / serine-pyruvate transaminase